MKLKPLSLLAASCALLGAAALAGTGDEQLDPATRARIARFESGPSTIDVSSYPKGARTGYKVFEEKCTLCHKLSRPINSDYALPDEWSRYVKRMMNKPGSDISKASARKIYEFLVFDSSVRKKPLLDGKLSRLTAAERAAEEGKIAAVRDGYQGR